MRIHATLFVLFQLALGQDAKVSKTNGDKQFGNMLNQHKTALLFNVTHTFFQTCEKAAVVNTLRVCVRYCAKNYKQWPDCGGPSKCPL